MPTQNLRLFGERCLVEVCFTIGYMFQLWGNLPHSIRYRILFTEPGEFHFCKGTKLTEISPAKAMFPLINSLDIIRNLGGGPVNTFEFFHGVRP